MFNKIIGVDFDMKKFLFNDKTVNIHLWDLSGQKNLEQNIETYFKQSNAIILVYDVTNES